LRSCKLVPIERQKGCTCLRKRHPVHTVGLGTKVVSCLEHLSRGNVTVSLQDEELFYRQVLVLGQSCARRHAYQGRTAFGGGIGVQHLHHHAWAKLGPTSFASADVDESSRHVRPWLSRISRWGRLQSQVGQEPCAHCRWRLYSRCIVPKEAHEAFNVLHLR